jgi:outer membrane protein assembly factor BamD
MEKADRDPMHAMRAEEECRTLLTQFPNSRYAPEAAQRLRQIQEVISESEYRVGSFYHHKGSFPAAANRLQNVTDHYPLYSSSDAALMKLGESYGKMGPRFREKSVAAYQKVVREYPLSASVDEAKRRLQAMEAEIPEADPVAYARMKYELENVTERGTMAKFWGTFSKSPDVSHAAKSGQPTMTSLRPTIPVSIPVPGATAPGAGVTDVTVSTGASDTSALDTKPDARLNQPAQGQASPNAPATGNSPTGASGAQPAATAPAAAEPPAEAGKNGKKKKEDKKKKK